MAKRTRFSEYKDRYANYRFELSEEGILILRALRARGVRLPAFLFADLDDRARVAFLEASLAPLAIVSSREGLPAIAARLRAAPRR